MKRRFTIIVAAIVAFAAYIPVAAWALPVAAQSIVYFDANNNIIGQQILYCTNRSYHSGDITPGNPYRIEESFSCENRMATCPEGAENSTQCSYGSDNTSTIDYFKSATGLIASNYCNDATYAGGPFFEHPACNLPAPAEVSKLTPYSSGWSD